MSEYDEPMTASCFRILVADDEPDILEGYASILESGLAGDEMAGSIAALDSELFGSNPAEDAGGRFDLTLCRQGAEAVEAVRAAVEAGDRYAIAFLDVRMPPGIDGVEAAEQIREIDPDINIVIVTGYTEMSARDIASRVRPLHRFLYCQKPLQGAELEQLARTLSAKWAAEKAMLDAKDLAERANEAKSQFLANMSHELRTPLSAVIGFSEIMKSETVGPISQDQYREYVHDIHDCGTHLLAMINDILDLSKIEAGRLEICEERLDLRRMLLDVIRLLREAAGEAGHEIRVDIPDDLPTLKADPRALKQIAINLLSNAIKFTPGAGEITVVARAGVGGVSLSVRDTGIGIAADQISTALEPFRQVDSGKDRKSGGTGLGLSLSAALAGLHGGRLRIYSQPGRGTTVTVRLPAKCVVAASSAA